MLPCYVFFMCSLCCYNHDSMHVDFEEITVRVILKYSFEVYNNYLRILNACFHIVCILYIVDNLVSNGIAED